MRRSYYKQEGYVVHEERGWNYPSDHYHVSSPNFHKMLSKASSDDHDDYDDNDMVLNLSRGKIRHDHYGSRGWGGPTRHVMNVDMKKNEHHSMVANTILRPPLGSVTLPPPPSRHHNHHDHHHYHQLLPLKVNNHQYVEDSRTFERYDNGGIGDELESLIKGLKNGLDGGAVRKIEVIQYERTRTYGGRGGTIF